MLRGEVHLLPYGAVHSDEMEGMIKDRNGTVQASELDSDAVRCKARSQNN